MSDSRIQRRRKNNLSGHVRKSLYPQVVLLIETSRAYGRGIIEGIARYSLENGPWSIRFEERGLESSPPEWFKEWRANGIIVHTTNAKLTNWLKATRLPLIDLFADRRAGVTPEITPDMLLGGRMVVEHFMNCGLRQFAYFSYGEVWWIKNHREIYCRALKERGHDCHCIQVPSVKGTVSLWHERYRPRVIQWLRSLPRPIGIFTPGDLHAVRLLDICRQLDIAVPEEMAILGGGNDRVLCETVHPTLSSLDLDSQRIGYEAARLLDQKMAGKRPKEMIAIPPSHVAIRQSTDHMAIEDADVAQAIQFIRKYACTGIKVARVANEIGLSRRVLERRFKHSLQRTPKAEIMRVRLERAKMLLVLTDKTSRSIARACGFTALAYFTTVFRRTVGMTPKAYRQARRRVSPTTEEAWP